MYVNLTYIAIWDEKNCANAQAEIRVGIQDSHC